MGLERALTQLCWCFFCAIMLAKVEEKEMGLFDDIKKGTKSAVSKAIEEKERRKEEAERKKTLGYLPDVTIDAEYKGGHPMLDKEKGCKLQISNDYLSITCGGKVAGIQYENITGIHYETAEQINRRITATRILTLGVFALAFKKKQKDTTKYLTIDFKESGIECTTVISGKKSNEAYSKLFERYSNFIKRQNGSL